MTDFVRSDVRDGIPRPDTSDTADSGGASLVQTKELQRVKREIRQLRSAYESVKRQLENALDADCRTCSGRGSVEGFLLGTIKRCPACDGSGLRGRHG